MFTVQLLSYMTLVTLHEYGSEVTLPTESGAPFPKFAIPRVFRVNLRLGTVAWNIFFMTTCTGLTFLQFKLGLIVHQCLRRRAPPYLVDYVVSHQRLRSASRRQLVVPRHCLNTFGCRAFAAAGPMSWNSSRNSLRESACDDNISDNCVKHSLKTFLFSGY